MKRELNYKSSKHDENTLQQLINKTKGWFSFSKNPNNTYNIIYNPHYDAETVKKNLTLKALFNTFCMIVYAIEEGYKNEVIIQRVKDI